MSSAADLNRFFRAPISGRLLGPAWMRQMQTARVTGLDDDYGLGLQTKVLPGDRRVWGHGGDIFGASVVSWSSTAGRRQVTVAAHPWGAGDADDLMDDFAAVAFGAD